MPTRKDVLFRLGAVAAVASSLPIRELGDIGSSDSGSSNEGTHSRGDDLLAPESGLTSHTLNHVNKITRRSLFSGSSRIARAEPLNFGCGDRKEDPNVFSPDFEVCTAPNEAAVYITSLLYKNTNDKPFYQKGEDKVVGLLTGTTYRLTNTANREQSVVLVVNEQGELVEKVKDQNGKEVEKKVFIMNGTPNSKTKDGKDAIRFELVRLGAWHEDRKEYADGDPLYIDSAVGCTPLWSLVPLNESVLGPKDNPTPIKEEPKPTIILPPAQVPSALPRGGDGSTPLPTYGPHIRRWGE